VNSSSATPIETFPALSAIDFVRHGFVTRVPGLDVKIDREAALMRLTEFHREARAQLGLERMHFVTAEQVHGCKVAAGDRATASPVPGADGLITNQPGVCLGIYVADCAAVYLVDVRRRAIGLVHSGKKGTELGIVREALEQMRAHFGSAPDDVVAQISPCIRQPHYEVDFPAQIIEQCRQAGVQQVNDCCLNTAADLDRYYSYRIEKGKTGRLLALLAIGD
jgi:copper oxidase (laccase) domain-containing protein